MTRQVIYRYLGTNGVLETPIHLEDVYYVRLIRLRADAGKLLTDGTRKMVTVTVPEDEATNWYEISMRDEVV
jgi:hypothetical protein